MDYRNADGSIAEMCGNGVRVFARYLARPWPGERAGLQRRDAGRDPRVRLEPDGRVTVDLGPVTVLGPGRAVVGGAVLEGLRVVGG